MSATVAPYEVHGLPVSRVPLSMRSLDDLELVHLRCVACGQAQTWVLRSEESLRAQMPLLACASCGVVGEMERAVRPPCT